MKIPRFEEKTLGFSPQMSISEYEESVRFNDFKNSLKRGANKILDIIDKPENQEQEDDYELE